MGDLFICLSGLIIGFCLTIFYLNLYNCLDEKKEE